MSEEQFDHRGTKFYKTEGLNDTVIVYYHGNAGTACDRYEVRELLTQTGASLLFVEYPGYAGDTEKTTEKSIINTVDHVIEYLSENYEEKTNVIVIGRSIGTGAAAHHAARGALDATILISPFTSLPAVAQLHYRVYPADLLMKDHFDNEQSLRDFTENVTIIHGKNDTIIPQEIGYALYEELQTQKKHFVSIESGDHNNLMEIEEFRTVFRDTVNTMMID